MHHLSRSDARRIAVRAQLLDARPVGDLLDVVRGLSLLQLDPTAAIAPSADLVAWSRLGSSYGPEQLRGALEAGSLVELRAMIRPIEDMRLYRADMADWPGTGDLQPWQEHERGWVEANEACRKDVLHRLGEAGPLRSRDLPDTCAIPWGSTGWNNNRNMGKLLDLMVQRGEVAVAGRKGRDRLWDLAENVYPDDPVVPAAEARRIRDGRRLRALGLARAHGPDCPVEPMDVLEAGEPAVIEGARGQWRVDPEALDAAFTGRTALLSPFDRLVHDRKRAGELFDFECQLGIYQPAAKRRWGYYPLPIVHGDRPIGKLDATADRKDGTLRVTAVHRDVDFTASMSDAVEAEIHELGRWLDLEVVMPG